MKAGETKRCYCNNCLTEFEIQLEPKLGEMSGREAEASRKSMPDKALKYCPFCSEQELGEA